MNKYAIKAARKNKPIKDLIYNERQIIDVFKAYKTHRKQDTFIKKEVLKSGANAGQTVDIEINKPFTLTSFCHFANIEISQFYRIMNNEGGRIPAAIQKIFTRILEEIKDEQLSGAIAGVYEPRITARINGLNDTEDKGKDKVETVTININKKTLNLTVNKLAVKE